VDFFHRLIANLWDFRSRGGAGDGFGRGMYRHECDGADVSVMMDALEMPFGGFLSSFTEASEKFMAEVLFVTRGGHFLAQMLPKIYSGQVSPPGELFVQDSHTHTLLYSIFR